LANVSATQLGSIVIKGAVEKAGLKPEQVEEVIIKPFFETARVSALKLALSLLVKL
jgi:acetyl-CoA acetyltransferase